MNLQSPLKNRSKAGSNPLTLRNLSGVLVLDVIGDFNKTTLARLEKTVRELVQAGHFNLVLNLNRAGEANTNMLRTLSRVVREVRKHYGGVTLVAGMEQAGQFISSEMRSLVRVCSSETDALLRIKGLRNIADPDQEGVSAWLAD